jgi:hypothetical protein
LENYFVPHFDLIKHMVDKHCELVLDKVQFLEHCEKCYSQLLIEAERLGATDTLSPGQIDQLFHTYCVITGYQPPKNERGDDPPDIFWNSEEEEDEFPSLINPARMEKERALVRAEIEFWNRQLGRQAKGHEAMAEVPEVATSVFPPPAEWHEDTARWNRVVEVLEKHGLVTFPRNGNWTDPKKKPRISKKVGHVAALFDNLSMEFLDNCGADDFVEKSFLWRSKKPNKKTVGNLKRQALHPKNGRPEYKVMLEEIDSGLTAKK